MPPYKRLYPISKDKLLIIKKCIDKYLNKGFICLSISLTATPILLAKKLRGGVTKPYSLYYSGLVLRLGI